jgi:hypothetical protein
MPKQNIDICLNRLFKKWKPVKKSTTPVTICALELQKDAANVNERQA